MQVVDLEVEGGGFRHLCFSPDGARLAWATEDGVIGVTDLTGDGEGGRRIHPLAGMDQHVVGLGFWSPNDLVAADAAGAAWSWRLPPWNDRVSRPERVVLRPPDSWSG